SGSVRRSAVRVAATTSEAPPEAFPHLARNRGVMSTTHTAIGYTDNLPATDPESFVARDVETPQPGPHDLLVDVRAVSVNPVDRKLRAGAPADGFRVLGFDAAGVVRAVGDEVSLFAPGDEVFYAGTIDRPGTNQRFHLVDERIVGPKPASTSFADAASLPLTAITAWETLFDRFRLTEASTGTLLVIGATGGLGSIRSAERRVGKGWRAGSVGSR